MTINHDCPYCGQSQILIVGDDNFTEEELNKLAVGQCDCDEARAIQERDRTEIDACAAVREVFAEESDSFRQFLLDGVHVLAMNTAKKFSATNEDGVKASLTRKEDVIRVERSITIRSVRE